MFQVARGRLFVLMFLEVEMRKVFGQQKNKSTTRGNTIRGGSGGGNTVRAIALFFIKEAG